MVQEIQLSNRQQKTRLTFMNAVLRLVMERGLDDITVTDIANEADYGRWAFYQYFESKEEAVWETFVYWMNQLDEMLIASVTHLESPRREYESWKIIFGAFHQQRQFFAKLESILASKWRTQAKEFLVDQFLQHLHNGNYALMEGVRPEIAARLYVTAIMELLEYWGLHPEIGGSDLLVDEFYTFIFNQPPPK